jgi:hypothetical protein
VRIATLTDANDLEVKDRRRPTTQGGHGQTQHLRLTEQRLTRRPR